MTIIAGVLSRHAGAAIPAAARVALRKHISRDDTDMRVEFQCARAYLVKVDIGAYASRGWSMSVAGSCVMIAGEPLLYPDEAGEARDVQLERLHAELDAGSLAGVCTASGTYCAAYVHPAAGVARLVADRLGLRPLYYAVVGDLVYFASALRIMEALEEVPKVMDVFAVAEATGFGYPFGGGTPYAGIRMLEPCEMITVREGEIARTRYFDWSAIQRTSGNAEDYCAELSRRFDAAVHRRLRQDRTALAYLSGGLDSRCVVAALRASGVRTYTFNFSLPRTQDQAFGREFAERIGAIHEDVPTEPGPDWSGVMATTWNRASRSHERLPERPRLAWTGEGGSVGLGHVYITPEIVQALQAGEVDDAIDIFLRQQNRVLLTRILKPRLAARLRGYLHARLRRELAAIPYPDPLRGFCIFLNLNGPRRHLEHHFDTIDCHRLEYQMPFYDAHLLEYISSLPVDPCLYHRLYVKWLESFPAAVLEVPWQAYPGHVASTARVPDDLPDQWTQPASPQHEATRARELRQRSAAMLSAADFPRPILSRSALRLMWWAWTLGLADYGYAMRTSLEYYTYWTRASTRHMLHGAGDLSPRTGGVA